LPECDADLLHTTSTRASSLSPPRGAKARWRQVRTMICWSCVTRLGVHGGQCLIGGLRGGLLGRAPFAQGGVAGLGLTPPGKDGGLCFPRGVERVLRQGGVFGRFCLGPACGSAGFGKAGLQGGDAVGGQFGQRCCQTNAN